MAGCKFYWIVPLCLCHGDLCLINLGAQGRGPLHLEGGAYLTRQVRHEPSFPDWPDWYGRDEGEWWGWEGGNRLSGHPPPGRWTCVGVSSTTNPLPSTTKALHRLPREIQMPRLTLGYPPSKPPSSFTMAPFSLVPRKISCFSQTYLVIGPRRCLPVAIAKLASSFNLS